MFKIKEYPKYISSVIDNIEKNEESMEVIYYKEWLLPFQKHNVNIQSIIYKNISIIEEFILKIGLASLGKNVTKDYIAEMLGLDMIFIETYIKKLAEDEFIYSNKLPIVETTSKGELYCEKKTTLDRIKEDSFEVYYNPQINITYNPTNLLKSTNEKEDIEILNLDFTFKDKIDNINEKLKENLLDMAKENNIIPVKKSINQQLKSITMKSIKEEIGYLRILELWIYDIVDKSLQCRVWNFEDNTFNNEISKFIVDKKTLKEEDFIISDELKEIPVTNNSNLLEEKFIKSKKEKQINQSENLSIALSEAKEEISILRKKVNELDLQNKKLNKDYDQLNKNFALSRKENANLKAEIDEHKATIYNLNHDLNENKKQSQKVLTQQQQMQPQQQVQNNIRSNYGYSNYSSNASNSAYNPSTNININSHYDGFNYFPSEHKIKENMNEMNSLDMELNALLKEKNMLENELFKFPERPRTLNEIKMKKEKNERIKNIEDRVNQIKMRIRMLNN